MPRTHDVTQLHYEDVANFITKIDAASSTVTYIGRAHIGSVVTEAVWQIKKIETSGNVTTISWADSDDNFVKVWNSRTGYTYG